MPEAKAKGENPAKGCQLRLYDTLGQIVPGARLLSGLLFLWRGLAAAFTFGRDGFGTVRAPSRTRRPAGAS